MNQFKIKYGMNMYLKFDPTKESNYDIVNNIEDATVYYTRTSAIRAIEAYVNYLDSKVNNTLLPSTDKDVLKSYFEIIIEKLSFKVKELWEYR